MRFIYLIKGVPHNINYSSCSLQTQYCYFSMQAIRKIMRIVGRIMIVSIIVLLCISRWLYPDQIRLVYQRGYDTFRQMCIGRRIVYLPLARDVS